MVARWRQTRLTTRTPTVARMSAKSSAVSPVAADSAMAGNGSATGASSPLEDRPALFHEGAAALDIVLGVEALLHQARKAAEISLAIESRQLLDGPLGRMHGERRVFADQLAVVVDVGVELRIGHDAVHQPHGERLLRGEMPGRD